MLRRVLAIFFAVVITLAFAKFYEGNSLNFSDIAANAGLTEKNVFGGLDRKDYILETTGNGVAIFDYDGDGRNDIFIANGTRLNSKAPSPPQLYHNEGNGHFQKCGRKRWASM